VHAPDPTDLDEVIRALADGAATVVEVTVTMPEVIPVAFLRS
jgi:hypothetical protein